MRGSHYPQATMLAFVDLEERVANDHPLRTVKHVAANALEPLSPEFDRMYIKVGRESVPPEGSIVTCLFANVGADLRGPLRAGASDADLAEITTRRWRVRDDRYTEQRAPMTDELRSRKRWRCTTSGGRGIIPLPATSYRRSAGKTSSCNSL